MKTAFLATESSKIQVVQPLWRSGGVLGASTTLPGGLVGQETALRAAQGLEERPAQFKLVCWQDPAETTPQGRKGLQQSPLPPCMATAQAKERTALLCLAIKENNHFLPAHLGHTHIHPASNDESVSSHHPPRVGVMIARTQILMNH